LEETKVLLDVIRVCFFNLVLKKDIKNPNIMFIYFKNYFKLIVIILNKIFFKKKEKNLITIKFILFVTERNHDTGHE